MGSRRLGGVFAQAPFSSAAGFATKTARRDRKSLRAIKIKLSIIIYHDYYHGGWAGCYLPITLLFQTTCCVVNNVGEVYGGGCVNSSNDGS